MAQVTAIMWFRQDLRVSDNPALQAAVRAGAVLPVFIYDAVIASTASPGSASAWWLSRSLAALNKTLGGRLVVRHGDAAEVLDALVTDTGASVVCWNRCYEPEAIARDTAIKQQLKARGVQVTSHKAAVLFEPWELLKPDGLPYKVFTAYYKRGYTSISAPAIPASTPIKPVTDAGVSRGEIEALGLLPGVAWYHKLAPQWQPGEQGAQAALQRFLDQGVANYREGRDFPAVDAVSRLSMHLHFGEISPQQIVATSRKHPVNKRAGEEVQAFFRELAWREFSVYQLYHFPHMQTRNLRDAFDRFPWQAHPQHLKAWQRGQTGYPLIDAGMRELWQTGFMHNRVRMVVASFLVKNLLIDWREGERWFRECLLDADLASNCANWQWVAGCGLDAAPYFRIFNPLTQSQKFDPDGAYIRRYVPELKQLPNKALHAPFQAKSTVLAAAGVTLGQTYPEPIVDLAPTRERALNAFASIRQARA